MERNEYDAVFDVLGLDEKPRASRLLWTIDGSSAWPTAEDQDGPALPNRRGFAFFWAAVQRPAPRAQAEGLGIGYTYWAIREPSFSHAPKKVG